jgi:signal transduction histidine kinase
MTARMDLTDGSFVGSPSSPGLATSTEVALLDLRGVIVSTNAAWDDFCLANDGDLARAGIGASYLDACAADPGSRAARDVADAIHRALRGDLPAPLSILIPCDSLQEPRVFQTLISSRLADDGSCIGVTVTLSRVVDGDPSGFSQPASVPAPFVDQWAPDALPALLRLTEVAPGETTMTQTLGRLAESARELMRVSYAAVSVSGPGGAPFEFAYSGIDPRTAAELVSPAAVAEWFERQRHTLTREVALAGRRLASLHVAVGAYDRFHPSVERLAGKFIEAVATAIENARLHQVSQRGHRWAEAAADLIQQLAARNASSPLDVVLGGAAKAAQADLAAILVPHDDAHVRLHAIVGGRKDIVSGKLFARFDSAAAEVMLTSAPLLLERPPVQVDLVSDRPMGPVAVVPLAIERTLVGALVVSRLRGRPPFVAADVEALSRFCEYAGIALDIDRMLADREQTQLYDDRTRIAHELHDQVVRQLFAVGMGLEGIIESLPDSELRARVSGYVATLDESIRGIRATVYRTADSPASI